MQLVVFRLNREEFAVLIERVREIIDYIPITKLPAGPAYFEGIINVRGKIVSVVDFAAKMGLSVTGKQNRKIIIVQIRDKDIGLTVDAVTEVIQTVPENFVSMGNVDASKANIRKVYRFHDRIITMLDIEQII